MGFDHHCAFFANCLTAPHIPTFILLLLLTPITTVLLSAPLYEPMVRRTIRAYRFSKTSERICARWWDWWGSWIVAGGPVGRWFAGVCIGWRELDIIERQGPERLGVGIMVLTGIMLALITAALGATSVMLILQGDLTIDRERTRSLSRAKRALERLQAQGREAPENLARNLEAFAEKKYFWVPVGEGGAMVETKADERPYDLGRRRNWERVMGRGWGWLLPWNGVLDRRGMRREEMFQWGLEPDVERRLRKEAEERIANGTT
ncbi:hypothetical protein P7C73_g750, partial [Tremellales sp. Uapishka_1]